MKKLLWMAAYIVVVLLLGMGIILLVSRPPRGASVPLLPPPTPAPITVYVSGAVDHAGLFSLPPGSRLNDAIAAAGGLTDNADSSSLNLARILEDGDQVTVSLMQSPPALNDSSRSENLTSGLVNINSATLVQLDSLPEIGPITAQAIIDYRQANGSFTRVEDILEVDGIGQSTFNKIKGLITTGTSP